MPFTPTTGQNAVLKLTLGGGLADWICPGMNWKFDGDGKVVDKSNFRDGRIKNGTLPDATITLTLVYDQADSPFKTTGGNLLLNVTGSGKFFVDPTHYIACSVIVTNIGIENPGMEDDLMLDVTLGLNGAITYPVGV